MALYNPRTWIAREGTNLNKFAKSSETASSVILENTPDAITQAGTPFTAAAMNNIEAGISALYAYDARGLGQTARNWTGITTAPNGDIYACVYSGDIYKQSGGTGDFVALGQTARIWYGLAAAPNGDIYACVVNGDIYKQAGGTGDFVALGQTLRGWCDLAAAPNGDIYACVFDGGDIYKQTGGVGDFVALGQASRKWVNLAAAPNGDIYACVFDGGIYKQTGGTGDFVALGQASRKWVNLAAAPNGDIYAVVHGGSIYRQTGGTGDFISTGIGNRNWLGITAVSSTDIRAAVNGGDIYKLAYYPKIGGVGSLYIGLFSAPASVLLFDGSEKSRASYPELWALISGNMLPSVTDAAWLAGAVGAFSTGDGSSTFRLPDWRGLFPRGAGTNSVLAMANLTKFTGGALAEIMLDAMQGHYHETEALHTYATGASSDGVAWSATNVECKSGPSVRAKGAVADGTNGTPRTAGETRPVSVSLNFGIYFE